MPEIRPLLKRCRHTWKEIKTIHRQIELVNTQGDASIAERYQELLRESEQRAMRDLSALEELIPKILDPRNRNILRCYYVIGMTERQIGEEMGITEEWVKKRRYKTIIELEKTIPAPI